MVKHGLFCGDFHCGHLIGLTPPAWQNRYPKTNASKRVKFHRIAADLWESFCEILESLPPLDFVVINGDMIEGKNERAGGTELLTSDMKIQANMAVDVIETIRKHAKHSVQIIATYGTPYHTSVYGDDWEDIIADKAYINKIGAHEWIDVNGLVFDIKHHIGSSALPHTRNTSISRDALWNQLWAAETMQPLADVVIRSHVHYFTHCGDARRLCMTLPALQGMGSKYGAKQCSSLVSWGMVLFSVKDKTEYTWKPFIKNIESQRAKALKL